MRRYTLKFSIISISALLLSCKGETKDADAYGNFEAIEITVSAQQSGTLLNFSLDEGSKLPKGKIVGYSDTVPLSLKRDQALAQKQMILSKYANIESSIEVQKQQEENLKHDIDRVKKLLEGGAATQKQLDDAEAALSVIEKQIKSGNTQFSLVSAELSSTNANIESVNDMISKCYITNPVDGIVLQKYTEEGEMVIPGKSLYKIANLDTLTLKAYISGAQLSQIAIGDTVKVRCDKNNKETAEYKGTVSFIASEAEFTPKIIQTKEERVNLVYAVKILVANPDGALKIGMPAEVVW